LVTYCDIGQSGATEPVSVIASRLSQSSSSSPSAAAAARRQLQHRISTTSNGSSSSSSSGTGNAGSLAGIQFPPLSATAAVKKLKFKIDCRKHICSNQPAYLHSLLKHYAPSHSHSLRYSYSNLLSVLRVCTCFGSCSFYFILSHIGE